MSTVPVCLLCRDRAVALQAVCAGLCYWLIESVFCATALPWRLVLAHTHTVAGQMRIHPAICPRETLPRPLLVPLPLCPSLFLPFLSHFYSFMLPPLSFDPPTHTTSLSPHFLLYFSVLTVLVHLCLFVPPLHFYHSCFLLSACVCVGMCGVSGCRVKVLPHSDRRLSECSVWSIGADTEGDPWSVTLETNFIKMNLSRGAVLTAA